jgi:hypothetical protein
MAAAFQLLDSTYGQRRKLRLALQDVILLPGPRLPMPYGNVHWLRADLNELLYLVRTATVWGVRSRVSGPFGNAQFVDVLKIANRLMLFLFAPADPCGGGEGSVGVGPSDDAAHFAQEAPNMRSSGSDGVPTAPGDVGAGVLEALDVASMWAPKLRDATASLVEPQHQEVLRACGLHHALADAVTMDEAIAWKGSICADWEKVESERRLTLVKRALLGVATGFCAGNPSNQELMFPFLSTLEQLSTPAALRPKDQQRSLDERAVRSANAAVSASARPPRGTPGQLPPLSTKGSNSGHQSSSSGTANAHVKTAEVVWPQSLEELAQNLLQVALRGHASLGERAPPTLMVLFAHIADRATDPSTSPALGKKIK